MMWKVPFCPWLVASSKIGNATLTSPPAGSWSSSRRGSWSSRTAGCCRDRTRSRCCRFAWSPRRGSPGPASPSRPGSAFLTGRCRFRPACRRSSGPGRWRLRRREVVAVVRDRQRETGPAAGRCHGRRGGGADRDGRGIQRAGEHLGEEAVAAAAGGRDHRDLASEPTDPRNPQSVAPSLELPPLSSSAQSFACATVQAPALWHCCAAAMAPASAAFCSCARSA